MPATSDEPIMGGRPGNPGMAGQPAPLRLLAVHAHPDDESSKGAATMARYVREGVQVLVVTLHRR